MDFKENFKLIKGVNPFPWQERIYDSFCANEFPKVVSISTGLGKTSVMTAWVLALATRVSDLREFPRRLIYVVNRRVVVDQSTFEAERIREKLELEELREVKEALFSLGYLNDFPLAISTLRGQFADNEEWRRDPSRPAIISGTIDMIGSRLLFDGYRCGFKTKPLHAGFLGQDSLLIHDEAHLEPPFQSLIESIKREQKGKDFKKFRVMEMTATTRNEESSFKLNSLDLSNEIILKRYRAEKKLTVVRLREKENLVDSVYKKSLEYKDSGEAILIFLNSVKDVESLNKKMRGLKVQCLTGTKRGFEREEMLKSDSILARFLVNPFENVVKEEGTVYLICTSAGEVGFDLSGDNGIFDAVTLDRMIQRIGRINRLGDKVSNITVFYKETKKEDKIDGDCNFLRIKKTIELLESKMVNGSCSVNSEELGKFIDENLFSIPPKIFPTSEVLFDLWSLTSYKKMSIRPEVDSWIHGEDENNESSTFLAWRDEVGKDIDAEELLEIFPLKGFELIRDSSDRIFKKLEGINQENEVWIVGEGVEIKKIKDLNRRYIANKTIVFNPKIGCLKDGFFGKEPYSDEIKYDISCEWKNENGDVLRGKGLEVPDGFVSVFEFENCFWYKKVKLKNLSKTQELFVHQNKVEEYAKGFVRGESDKIKRVVEFAARHHDDGKNREVWQNIIGNEDFPNKVLAKSNKRMRNKLDYRHEFGSVNDIKDLEEFNQFSEDEKDLILHIVSSHHGRSRPDFTEEESFDPDRGGMFDLNKEIVKRFERLMKQYGRWGLAYIESILRAADYAASGEED